MTFGHLDGALASPLKNVPASTGATLSHAYGVQDISIVTAQLPTVYRLEGTQTVYLTFEGIRDSRTIADKQTRVRVSMPAATAAGFCQLLGDVVNDRSE